MMLGIIIGLVVYATSVRNGGGERKWDIDIQYSHTVDRLPAASSSMMTSAVQVQEQEERGGEDNVHYNDDSSSTLELPIYLLRPSTSIISITSSQPTTTNNNASTFSASTSYEFAHITWEHLSQSWNRTTNYHDLFPSNLEDYLGGSEIAGIDAGTKLIPSLPFASSSLPSLSETQSSAASSSSTSSTTLRTLIVLHASPKTGSTTLRTACTKNLNLTCNATQSHSELRRHSPPGYSHETTFFGLVQECSETYHFCTNNVLFFPSSATDDDRRKQTTFTENTTLPPTMQTYPNTLFIHTFPFRNYDQWALSALRQQYSRAEEEGCDRVKSLLMNNCERDHMELDIRQYTKMRMKNVWKSVVRRLEYLTSRERRRNGNNNNEEVDDDEEGEEHHLFLLYHHSELHSTMQLLSEMYGIPTLPGLEKRFKDNSGRKRKKNKKTVTNETEADVAVIVEEETEAVQHEGRRKMRRKKRIEQQKDLPSDENGTNTTATVIGEEDEPMMYCKEEERLLDMFHDCFSDELMVP
ncbi:hypothetical protein ACHAWU_006678 [Discostella pseudostelligera]|uniref:Uncharacterized protein n=1 Tax=Discostella pseudostelligera TaxID=259834 RepID=A0ABD3M0H5_9STRA